MGRHRGSPNGICVGCHGAVCTRHSRLARVGSRALIFCTHCLDKQPDEVRSTAVRMTV
jgi:hypothetical protein